MEQNVRSMIADAFINTRRKDRALFVDLMAGAGLPLKTPYEVAIIGLAQLPWKLKSEDDQEASYSVTDRDLRETYPTSVLNRPMVLTIVKGSVPIIKSMKGQ